MFVSPTKSPKPISASKVTTIWRYTNVYIIIIIIEMALGRLTGVGLWMGVKVGQIHSPTWGMIIWWCDPYSSTTCWSCLSVTLVRRGRWVKRRPTNLRMNLNFKSIVTRCTRPIIELLRTEPERASRWSNLIGHTIEWRSHKARLPEATQADQYILLAYVMVVLSHSSASRYGAGRHSSRLWRQM